MQNHRGAAARSDKSSKPKKPKSREVSSRFLSPASSSSSTEPYSNQSPNSILSPIKQKPRSSIDSRKHKRLENSGFLRGLWPSSSVASPSSNLKPNTLADCIGNDRIKEREERKNKGKSDRNLLLHNRQRSCSEFGRFENEKKISTSAKENHHPILGGSMRYTGKFGVSRKSSKLPDENDVLSGRFSVELRKKSFSRGLSDSDTQDSESEYSDTYSGSASFDTPAAGKDISTSFMAPTVSSRKHGIDVPSKFMHDASSRLRRLSSDSGHSNDDSPKIFSLKNALKKANGSWASSPGPSGSSKGDNKGKKMGLTNLKPPTSPSRGKGVGNLISLGIELLKGKKSSSSSSSPLGPGSAENIHQLRLLHTRLMQWRYSNARGEAVNGNIIKHVEGNFLRLWNVLITLQRSVLQKKLHLQKEKLEMKLNYVLNSQIKALETWGNMERQHSSAISTTAEYLQYVVCRIPLVDGAKVEQQSACIAIRNASDIARNASDIAESFNLMLTDLSTIEKTVGVLSELAVVTIQEKQLLEECLELFRYISTLEIQERSLKSHLMQLRLLQQRQQQMLT